VKWLVGGFVGNAGVVAGTHGNTKKKRSDNNNQCKKNYDNIQKIAVEDNYDNSNNN
jgi:hypothetical protein